MTRKERSVCERRDAETLVKLRWRPRYIRGHWWLCKYARKRRVHNSVAIAMGWALGMRGGRRAGLICTTEELGVYLRDDWCAVRERGVWWLRRGDVRVAVHPDLSGGLEAYQAGGSLTRSNARENFQNSFLLPAGAGAREDFAKHLRKRKHVKGSRIGGPKVTKPFG